MIGRRTHEGYYAVVSTQFASFLMWFVDDDLAASHVIFKRQWFRELVILISTPLVHCSSYLHGFVADPSVGVGESRCSGGETLTFALENLRSDQCKSVSLRVCHTGKMEKSTRHQGFQELWRVRKHQILFCWCLVTCYGSCSPFLVCLVLMINRTNNFLAMRLWLNN